MGAAAPVDVGVSWRMGNEGKLLATGVMSDAAPKMNPSSVSRAVKQQRLPRGGRIIRQTSSACLRARNVVVVREPSSFYA